MNKKIFSFLLLPTLFIGCAQKNVAKFKTENNHPKFANARSFENTPEELTAAAKLVLQEMIDHSEVATNDPVKVDDAKNQISADWIYSTSKDKYVEYKVNESPKRKALRVRRRYTYTIEPSIAGAEVTVSVVEEIEELDLKSGKAKAWKKMTPDSATYQNLLSELKNKIRAN